MPSWSIRYQGALDDQQINDIVNYLVFMSSEERPVQGQHLHQPRRGQGGQLAVALGGKWRDRSHRRDRGDRLYGGWRLMLAQEVHSCLGFHIECGTLFKGAGVTLMAFILFLGSVYLMLSLVFGKWMGYLVLAVCFSGWLIIHSSLW